MAHCLFNGKPQATAFLSQASVQNTVACGLPLNESFTAVRGIRHLAMLLAVAALFLAGCDTPTTATDDSADSAKQSVPQNDSTDALKKPTGQKNVTFFVAGMNGRLKIL